MVFSFYNLTSSFNNSSFSLNIQFSKIYLSNRFRHADILRAKFKSRVFVIYIIFYILIIIMYFLFHTKLNVNYLFYSAFTSLTK